MKFFENLMNFLKFKESEDYDFVLPDADASQDSQTTNNSPELDPLKNVNESKSRTAVTCYFVQAIVLIETAEFFDKGRAGCRNNQQRC